MKAKLLNCPRCGAPLAWKQVPVVECPFCKSHVVVASGQMTTAAADAIAEPGEVAGPGKGRAPAAAPHRRPPARSSKGPLHVAVVVFVVVALAGVGAGFWMVSRSSRAHDDTPTAQEQLLRLELSMTPASVGELLARPPSADITVDYRVGDIRRAEIKWNRGDKHVSAVTLLTRGDHFDLGLIRERLRSVSPHRLRAMGRDGHRITVEQTDLTVNKTYLSVTIRPGTRDGWEPRLAAQWAALRYAAFDGRLLTPEELRLLNGPRLSETLRLDTSLTVEHASDRFLAAFSDGSCRTQVGVLCRIEVDHPIVDEVTLRWPNAVRGRLRQAVLAFAASPDAASAQPAVAGCLSGLLGAGKEEVIDYVKGTRSFTWSIGGGDTAVLAVDRLTLSAPETASLDAAAVWPTRFSSVVEALERCTP